MGKESMYSIHQNAYLKLVLHSLKHRTSAVNALLIGRVSGGATETVEILDSVPLFHSQISLLPSLQIALIMIQDYYAQKGLSVVGYFHANQRFNDSELALVAKNIADHITNHLPQAALLLLDDQKLGALPKTKDATPVLQLYTKDASSWKIAGSDGGIRLTLKEPSANIALLDFISSEKWSDIVDFDDHLDDISKDWLNPELFK